MTTGYEDGLPVYESLSNERRAITEAYAQLLAQLAGLAAVCSAAASEGHHILLKRLQNDAIWAVGEVKPATTHKIRRQRYISQGVYDRWQDVLRDPRWLKRDLDTDSAGRTLCHEHAVERRTLASQLERLTDSQAIMSVLERVEVCIVTAAEDLRLSQAKPKHDWDRYTCAPHPGGGVPGIGVYDRELRCWKIPRSPAPNGATR